MKNTPRRVLLACIGVFAIWLAGEVPASEQSPSARSMRTERTPAMRQQVYARLSQARELADGESYDEAMRQLEAMQRQNGLNGYESGMVWNLTAYVHYARGDHAKAIEAYRKVLAQDGIPTSLETQTLYSLAQMYFVSEQYADALESLNRWFALSEQPSPSAYVLRGQAHYQLEDYGSARADVERAISRAKEQGSSVNESWYLLLRAIHYSNRDYPQLLEVLKALVAEHAKREYWVQLAAVYGELGQQPKQLAVLETAFDQGMLTEQRDVVGFAQLLLVNGVPHKGGQVLEEAMRTGVVERNLSNLQLLADAWLLARHHDEGAKVLREAAELADDGKLYFRLAQTLLETADYAEARDAASAALQKGGLKEPGQAHVVAALANYHLGRLDEAMQDFREAERFEESAEFARQWLEFVQREQRQRAILAEGNGAPATGDAGSAG